MSALGSRLFLARHLASLARHSIHLRYASVPPIARGTAGSRVRVTLLPSAPATDVGMAHRMFAWGPHLERRGFAVRVIEPCSTLEYRHVGASHDEAEAAIHKSVLSRLSTSLRMALDSDVIVVHRSLLPFSPYQRPTLELLLARKNPRLVFDFFDSLWARGQAGPEASAFGRWLNPPDRLERILRAAAAVTVSSEYLADYARKFNDEVHVIPMVLHAGEYAPRAHAARSPVVVGWMGNAGNLVRLSSVVPAVRRAAADRRLRLKVISWQKFEAEGIEVESLSHPWSPESEKEDLASFDIGILPLFDTVVDRGKSPFKLLQYAAAGLPVVASPYAVDRTAFVDGESVLLAETEEQWTAALGRLADDPALRARVGAAAREVVLSHFTYERHADRFAGILRRVADRP